MERTSFWIFKNKKMLVYTQTIFKNKIQLLQVPIKIYFVF